jgi:two-component system, cell cycle sensor histidine kinase and response regulator CckA
LGLAENNYVKISIKDQGMGIPKSLYDKLFDPYFTTKQKGSGLGLATAYSIIKNHNGLINFQSELGKGTTFNIYLPALKKKARKTEQKARGASTPTPATRGKILVTDDEKILRDALNKLLLAVGYDVETASSGEEAVGSYEGALQAGKPFDAVILDLTMPGGMGGKETMARLREIDPRVKAIVSSGYANDAIMSDYQNYGFSAVVTKPFSIEEMYRKLEDLIGKP